MVQVVDEILTLSAIELSRRLHAREITAVQLLTATLNRIDEVNPKINAIIALRKDRDAVFQEARQADSDLDAAATSSSTGKKPGWLTGIPLCIKDLENAKGLPTTLGGCPLIGKKLSNAKDTGEVEGAYRFDSGWVFKNAEVDDPYVRRLREAGALIIGKTNTPELGLGCHSYNTVHGTTLNPYNLSLSAGGSSGGAAAALASHMVCVSDGSDMFGSLRNPAGWNKLYSLRPTSSLMEEDVDKKMMDARKNGTELDYPISTIGPMARCPEDLVRFFNTILPKHRAEFDVQELLSCAEVDLDTIVAKSNIGWLNNWGGAVPFEDGILDHCRDALKAFEAGGATVQHFTEAPFSNVKLWDAWVSIRSSKIFTTIQERSGLGCVWMILYRLILQTRGAKPEAIWECNRGRSVSKEQLKHAVNIVQEWARVTDDLFTTYDFLALPSSQVYPFDSSIHWPKSIAGQNMDTYHRWMEVMVPVTILGLPCVTVPCGAGHTGSCIGLSIFAKRGSDHKLLQLAQWYHNNSTVKPGDLAI